MENPTLTIHQLRILAEGIKNDGIFPVDLPYKIYSSDESARNAIMFLESWGFIRLHSSPGYFVVVKAPDEAFMIADNLKNDVQKKSKITKKRQK